MSIHRCPHDRENPYAQISRALIRDKSISFECRAFIIYCLSYDAKWEISIPYFMKEQEICKDRMYRILNEALSAGYIKREVSLEKGLKRFKYYVSEYPKFKEFLPYPENEDTDPPDPENQDTTNKQSYERTTDKKASSIPLPPSKGEETPNPLKGAAAAASSEKEVLKKELLNRMKPDEFEHGWKVYELKRKLETIDNPAGMIYRSGKDKWPIPASVSSEEDNYALMEKITARCKDFIERNQIVIGYNYIEFPWSNGCYRFEVHEKGFREAVLSQLRKMKIDVQNL